MWRANATIVAEMADPARPPVLRPGAQPDSRVGRKARGLVPALTRAGHRRRHPPRRDDARDAARSRPATTSAPIIWSSTLRRRGKPPLPHISSPAWLRRAAGTGRAPVRAVGRAVDVPGARGDESSDPGLRRRLFRRARGTRHSRPFSALLAYADVLIAARPSAPAATAMRVRVFRAWRSNGSASLCSPRCTRRIRVSGRPTARRSWSPLRSTSPVCGTRFRAWPRSRGHSLRAASSARPTRRGICHAVSGVRLDEQPVRRRRPPAREARRDTRSEAPSSTSSSRPPPSGPFAGLVAPATGPGACRRKPDRLPTIRAQAGAVTTGGRASLRSESRVSSRRLRIPLANEDPNRLVPLDTARALEAEGRLGRVHDAFYTTTGNGTPVAVSTQFGREIAAELTEAGVHAVLLSGT